MGPATRNACRWLVLFLVLYQVYHFTLTFMLAIPFLSFLQVPFPWFYFYQYICQHINPSNIDDLLNYNYKFPLNQVH